MEFKKLKILMIIILICFVGMSFSADWERTKGMTEEQQVISDFIFNRLEEGYDSWMELVDWANKNDIPYSFSEYEGAMMGELIEKIHLYGPSGDFIQGSRTFRASNDAELTLFFENLTYQRPKKRFLIR